MVAMTWGIIIFVLDDRIFRSAIISMGRCWHVSIFLVCGIAQCGTGSGAYQSSDRGTF